MTSKEAFIKIRELMNEYHHYFVKESIKVKAIDGYPLDQIEKDLEELEKYRKVMCKPILDIMKELELLDQLKEILSMDYLVRVYGYDMAKRLQTYLKSNDIVKEWLEKR